MLQRQTCWKFFGQKEVLLFLALISDSLFFVTSPYLSAKPLCAAICRGPWRGLEMSGMPALKDKRLRTGLRRRHFEARLIPELFSVACSLPWAAVLWQRQFFFDYARRFPSDSCLLCFLEHLYHVCYSRSFFHNLVWCWHAESRSVTFQAVI